MNTNLAVLREAENGLPADEVIDKMNRLIGSLALEVDADTWKQIVDRVYGPKTPA